YYRSDGLAEDKAKAEHWFRRAAQLGLSDAQYALGQVLSQGLTSAKNESEALQWYEQAAAQGHAKARVRANDLRQAGVTPQMAAVPAAPAQPEPAPAPAAQNQTAAVPDAPEPVPPAPPAAKPAAQPAAQPAAPSQPASQTAAQPATQPAAGMAGGFDIWLASEKSAAAAASYLSKAREAHPGLFAQAEGRVASADLGKGGLFYRVLAGGFASRAEARDGCASLHAEAPGTFCVVLSN
ncbi:MAG: SPOR domain-containing protein, partial [Kiloniellales bacterium]